MSDFIQRRAQSTFNKGILGDPVTFQTRPLIGERNTEQRNTNNNPTLITIEAAVKVSTMAIYSVWPSAKTLNLFSLQKSALVLPKRKSHRKTADTDHVHNF